MNKSEVVLSAAVADALRDRVPVVALESTVITHGLAFPANFETAMAMERDVRDGGAEPATVAVLGGQVRAGLSETEIRQLAEAQGVRKCSVRDLGIVAGLGMDGGTTVAATMWIAAQAGIDVFATGGIGGVHRGHPFDVSADLVELSRTPVTVVCAGAKALLDLPLTFEHLETMGVPVIGWDTDEIPAFYSRRSGLKVDVNAASVSQVVEIIRARRRLGLPGGELVCVPVPEQHELAIDIAEAAIMQAQREADAAGVYGAASTPWLLARIAVLTNGASVRANTALLINNARVAAEIAHALAGGRGE